MARYSRRTPSRRNSSTRRQKARQASTQRMLEDAYGTKFKNPKLSSLNEYIIDYCRMGTVQNQWDAVN